MVRTRRFVKCIFVSQKNKDRRIEFVTDGSSKAILKEAVAKINSLPSSEKVKKVNISELLPPNAPKTPFNHKVQNSSPEILQVIIDPTQAVLIDQQETPQDQQDTILDQHIFDNFSFDSGDFFSDSYASPFDQGFF